MKITRKCHGCGENFRKTEMIEYQTLSGKTTYYYCEACYKERLARDKFATAICQIYGLKQCGPKIWTQRRTLNEQGIDDATIIDTLNYLFSVEKVDKAEESLGLVTPSNIKKMERHKIAEQEKTMQLAAAAINGAEQKITRNVIVIPQRKRKKNTHLNPDDFLEN